MNGRGDSVTVVAAEEENWIFVTECLKQVSIAPPLIDLKTDQWRSDNVIVQFISFYGNLSIFYAS